MSLFEQFIEKPAIVIDIGHAYTKCGFSGDPSPFAILPTPLMPDGSSIFDISDTFSESDDRDRKQALIDLVYKVYYKVLNANTRERKLVLVESIFTPTSFRRALASVLFSNFQCLSVAFIPSHLAAIYTLAIRRALVVDCGYVDCQVVPIAEGIPLSGLCDFANFGAKRLHEEIEALIRAYCMVTIGNKQVKFSEASHQAVLTDRVLEDIKLKCCFVTSYERAQKIYAAVEYKGLATVDFYDQIEKLDFKFAPECDYPLDSRTILHVPGWMREMACEVLFVNRVDRELTLPQLILNTLVKAPVDLRRDLASNIVLIGGSFMQAGLKNRLADELKVLVSDASELGYAQKLPFKKVAFHCPPSHHNYTAWLGASIFAGLDVIDLYSIQINKFKETQKLPDWFQLTASHKTDMVSI